MYPCLLCRGDSRELDCLSGEELRRLWRASGACLDEEAFGPITGEYQVCLLECKRCEFRFFDPNLAGTEAFYRQLQDENYFAIERPEFIRTLNFAKRRGLKKVLDIGCGSGAFLNLAQAEGLTTHGLELNTVAAEEARSRSHVVFSELLDGLHRNGFPERYDLITLFQVLEHVADPVETIRQAAGLLNPKGYISVAVPNAYGLPRFAWLQPQQWPPHHVSQWRKKDFYTLARSTHLRIVKVEADLLLGRSIAQTWTLQNKLARAINRKPPFGGRWMPSSLSFIYRKLGLKFVVPRLGSSIQAYFSQQGPG